MILEGQGNRFALTVSGYQFPEQKDDKHDANWLLITIDVETPSGSYSSSNACFLTWELAWIALWLRNLSQGLPQKSEMGGIEPVLEFEHVGTEGDAVELQVRCTREMAPPWIHGHFERMEGITLSFVVSRSHVADAAASLWAEIERFPPRGRVRTEPPFVPRTLSASFFIDWLLIVPGSSEPEVVRLVVDYMESLGLEANIRSASLVPERTDAWYVRFTTGLHVPSNEPFYALFQMLSHLPKSYGLPQIGGPLLWPDGAFRCSGQLAPIREEEDEPESKVRGWFELVNYEEKYRFRMLGTLAARAGRKGALYTRTWQIINLYDPAQLVERGFPRDEYLVDMERIFPSLRPDLSIEEIRRLLHDVLVTRFDPGTEPAEEVYDPIARDIHAIWVKEENPL